MKLKFTILLCALNLFTAMQVFAQVSASSLENSFIDYLRSASGSVNTGSLLPNFISKENTRGNRYLFGNWTKGSVTGTDGVVYNPANAKFNYDKIDEKLFMFVDNKTVMELSSGIIAGFTIANGDSAFRFERLKNSTDLHFYQPVYKAEKGYSLYKRLETKFKKADYQSNGIIESGNKYDEYVDGEMYFILSPKGEMTKIEFKKKSIERALVNEASKVDSFFSEHKKETVNETFVKSLLQSLNS